MKMSKGQIGRRLLGGAVVGAAQMSAGAAFAELGQPAPWEYKLQESATQVMENITWFHNFLLVIITAITLLWPGAINALFGQSYSIESSWGVSRAFFEWVTLGAFGVMVLLGIAFWAIGARNVRRGLLAPADATEAEPR